jgi:hypothetical protein
MGVLSQSSEQNEVTEMNKRKDNIVGGLVLIAIGGLALLSQFTNLESMALLFLPALGAIFLVWGIAVRHFGPMIPGGILSGIGLGTILVTRTFETAGESVQGGAFMLAFAGGWATITILSAIFTRETQWWPLIPGGIMALIGGTILLGGVFKTALILAGRFWPLALIVLGIYVLWQALRSSGTEEKSPEKLELS